MLRYLATKHDSLRIPSTDTNRARWPLHPLWLDLIEQIKNLPAIGIDRDLGRPANLHSSIAIIERSLYGNLKQLAGLQAVLSGCDTIPFDSALQHLNRGLKRFHDPLTWRLDVGKRIKNIQLGQP